MSPDCLCLCRLFLDSNPPAVLVGALLTASQLARLHRDNYIPLAKAAPYPHLRKLLSHTEPAVRARVCNLLGNMCRHSAYFYTALDRHSLLTPLIQRCTDEDIATRKFACFAIGNAGEKSDIDLTDADAAKAQLYQCLCASAMKLDWVMCTANMTSFLPFLSVPAALGHPKYIRSALPV